MLAWATIVGNALAGVYALAAWRIRELRGPAVWVLTAAAQVVLAAQVTVGVLVVSDEAVELPGLHAFYGFAALLTVGLAYGYRQSVRGRLELFYGLVGLFLMGMAIRAFTLV